MVHNKTNDSSTLKMDKHQQHNHSAEDTHEDVTETITTKNNDSSDIYKEYKCPNDTDLEQNETKDLTLNEQNEKKQGQPKSRIVDEFQTNFNQIDNKTIVEKNDRVSSLLKTDEYPQSVDIYKEVQDFMIDKKKIQANDEEKKGELERNCDEFNDIKQVVADELIQQQEQRDSKNSDFMNDYLLSSSSTASATTTSVTDTPLQQQQQPTNTIDYALFSQHAEQPNIFQTLNYHQQQQQNSLEFEREMSQYEHQNFFLMQQHQHQPHLPPPPHLTSMHHHQNQTELYLNEQQHRLLMANQTKGEQVNALHQHQPQQIDKLQSQACTGQALVPMHENYDDGYETCAGDVATPNSLLTTTATNIPSTSIVQYMESPPLPPSLTAATQKEQDNVPSDDIPQTRDYDYQEQAQQQTNDINSVYEEQTDHLTKCQNASVAGSLLKVPHKRRGRKKKFVIDNILLFNNDKNSMDMECDENGRNGNIGELKLSTDANDDISKSSGSIAGEFRMTQDLISHAKIIVKERKRHDRFNGMPEEEVVKRTLPDHICDNLDIVIVGINPGLFAAYKGHHYAGPGNHFWKCLYLSGITQEQMSADEDYKLINYGIGFTNMVQRATKGSADLTRKEIKEGSRILLEKMQRFRPKIVVFNGKLIFEVFSGKKRIQFWSPA